MVVVVELSDRNTTPELTTLLSSVLDVGNMYGVVSIVKEHWSLWWWWDFPIVIPLQNRQLYLALAWILAICME